MKSCRHRCPPPLLVLFLCWLSVLFYVFLYSLVLHLIHLPLASDAVARTRTGQGVLIGDTNSSSKTLNFGLADHSLHSVMCASHTTRDVRGTSEVLMPIPNPPNMSSRDCLIMEFLCHSWSYQSRPHHLSIYADNVLHC